MFEYNWIKNKSVFKNLLGIKGISNYTATKYCAFLGISKSTKYSELANHKLEQLNLVLSVLNKKTEPLLINKLKDLDPEIFNNPATAISKGQNINHMPILKSWELWKKNNIIREIELNTYRGRRFKYGYPVKGQRTRTNARTARKLNRLNNL